VSLFNFLFASKSKRRKEEYRKEYRQMTEEERDSHLNTMKHYSVYGGPFSLRKMREMCEAAVEVEQEEMNARNQAGPSSKQS